MAEIIEIGSDGCFELPEAPVEAELWKPVESKKSKENKPTVPKAEESVNPSKVFKANSEVELRGLKTEHLNGTKATVIAYDRAASRYAVLLAESGKTIKIKPENLFTSTVLKPCTPEEVVKPKKTTKGKKTPNEESTCRQAARIKVTSTVSLNSKSNTVIVKVKLPMLENSAGANLRVGNHDLVLTYGEGDDEFIRVDFPTRVQPSAAVSKFFKESKTMKISIPVHEKH
jgi:hypothetical protein